MRLLVQKVYDLLNSRYGLNQGDVDDDIIVKDLEDGEEPEAIVDAIGDKYLLTRIDLSYVTKGDCP